ncbi:MAG TPA: polysaccharide deacetylase family protein [Gemmataceae bacterium]|nr:polysaccharide deacetylase family protein [Gemmataceae bacterium]
MTRRKPLASVSLDLDNKWSYLKTHGDPGWESFPTYLPLVVPRVLRLLEDRGLTVTVFVVGQDAARDENRAALASIAAAGHEIGNHSFHHEPWLHLYSEEEIEADLGAAEGAIQKVTGRKPVGFRGPGFSLSPAVLEVLARRGYLYDASTFPTFLGPLARAYYFMTARLDPEEKKRRALLFGSFREGFRPLRPYRWLTAARPLVELPVTTMPLFRVPIHVSYVLYLACRSAALARAYFRAALLACRLARVRPSLLLHPLDFLGGDDERDLSFFPAMGMPGARKLRLVGELLDLMAREYTIVPMREHALASPAFRLPTLIPS